VSRHFLSKYLTNGLYYVILTTSLDFVLKTQINPNILILLFYAKTTNARTTKTGNTKILDGRSRWQ
jgi:hypothetical protein